MKTFSKARQRPLYKQADAWPSALFDSRDHIMTPSCNENIATWLHCCKRYIPLWWRPCAVQLGFKDRIISFFNKKRSAWSSVFILFNFFRGPFPDECCYPSGCVHACHGHRSTAQSVENKAPGGTRTWLLSGRLGSQRMGGRFQAPDS
jgi:hypothetical protein